MSWLRATVHRAMKMENKNRFNQPRIHSDADIVTFHIAHVIDIGANLVQDDQIVCISSNLSSTSLSYILLLDSYFVVTLILSSFRHNHIYLWLTKFH